MNGTIPLRTNRIQLLPSLCVAALTFACQACAVSYLDADGNRHVVGFVDITVHPPAEPQTFAGDVVDLTAVRLTVSQTAQGGYVSIGYSREVLASMRDNALIVGDPLHPLARLNRPMRDIP
jgi:hypothetical protein